MMKHYYLTMIFDDMGTSLGSTLYGPFESPETRQDDIDHHLGEGTWSLGKKMSCSSFTIAMLQSDSEITHIESSGGDPDQLCDPEEDCGPKMIGGTYDDDVAWGLRDE
jgi:hypothetical protein